MRKPDTGKLNQTYIRRFKQKVQARYHREYGQLACRVRENDLALRQYAREMNALYQTVVEISREPGLDTLLQAVICRATALVHAAMGGLSLLQPDGQSLKMAVVHGLPDHYIGVRIGLGEGVAGRVAQTGQPLTVSDYYHWEGQIESFGPLALRRIMGVPMRVGDRVVGVIVVCDTHCAEPFGPNALRLVHLLADQAAIAIENRRLLAREQQQRALAEALSQAAMAVNSTLDLDQVLDHILEQVERVVPGDAFNVMLIKDGQACVVRWRYHETLPFQAAPPGFAIPVSSYPLLARMVQTGHPVVIADTSQEVVWVPGAAVEWRRSYVGAPIRVAETTVGFLNVNGVQAGQFQDQDAQRLAVFASHAATAIQNARLYEQARQDAETRAVLLREVNHRVKNNLAAIIGLIYTAQRHMDQAHQQACQPVMQSMISRIQGLSTVHSLLSASGWASLRLDHLIGQIIYSALPADLPAQVEVTPSPLKVNADQAHHLALIINELTTNTLKYGLRDGCVHIQVSIESASETGLVRIEFRDYGAGFCDEALRLERSSVGLDLLEYIVRISLRGDYGLHNDHGAVITIEFQVEPAHY